MADLELVIETATGRLARRMDAAADRLPMQTREAVDDLAADSELIFAAHAPSASGRLGRGIEAHTGGPGIGAVITATARNPETGFDYVGVTRKGHRVAWIYPKRAKALRWVTMNGRVFFAKRVRGQRPAFDWRDKAMPQVQERTRIIATRLGRSIEVRG